MAYESVDTVVVGAGVIGLAVARAVARAGREVIVLEARETIGTETSSRNSEVVHAGIHYPKDSNMARLCVEGRRMLYRYCGEHGIRYITCGKLIVATTAGEVDTLAAIRARAEANGVEGIRFLSAAEATSIEPELHCTGALLSPTTGIIDSHGLMVALRSDAEDAGAIIAFHSPMERGRTVPGGVEIDVGGQEPITLRARLLINSAGLHAPTLARTIVGGTYDTLPSAYYAKGNYFRLSGKSPFSRLVYPVPVPGGLGVHVTVDLGGQARFGPDVEWIDEIDYGVDPSRGDSFYAAVRRYWPDLKDEALQPDFSGIRPKIVPPGAPAQDFTFHGPATHHIPGLIHLFGIESPGLTASLAIGEHVAAMARAT
jgi:L-2-hydroxyglutarate oxidase LhgO